MATPTGMEGPPRKILLATDLSCRCDRALDRAALLAREWDARLLVLHVIESRKSMAEEQRLREEPTWRHAPDRTQIVEDQIRRDLIESPDTITVRVEEGEPADVINDVAERERCDLIITGIARDETLGRYFLGTTVDRLVRRSPIPVLVVKNRARRAYKQVVVATDFSEASLCAFNTAVRYFEALDLSLFHSFRVPFAGFLDHGDFRARYREVERQACADFLRKSVAADEIKQRLNVLNEYGSPEILLRSYVKDKSMDLVVIGTHGEGGIMHVALGSTAKRILEGVPCDILVVRDPRAIVPV